VHFGKGIPASLLGLDLNLLVALDVLFEIRNVTATAERVGVTQSAVSHRLARIREFFDDPLFVSAGDDLLLTQEAEALQTPLRLALRGLRDAILSDEELDPATTKRSFAIPAADLAEIGMVPPLLARLSRVAPGARIRIKGPGFVTSEALAEGPVDFVSAPAEGCVPRVSL